jgi:hypothetical protein
MARGPGLLKAVLDEEPGPLPVSNRSGRCHMGEVRRHGPQQDDQSVLLLRVRE